MLSIVQRPVADGGDDFSQDEKRIAVQVVSRSASHDDGTGHMKSSKHDGQQRTAKFVDSEAKSDT